MPAVSTRKRKTAGMHEHQARQQAAGRRVALWVAALLVAALLGPFVARMVAD